MIHSWQYSGMFTDKYVYNRNLLGLHVDTCNDSPSLGISLSCKIHSVLNVLAVFVHFASVNIFI